MFSRFQHLERWRFQPYADREDPFKRTYLTRDKLIWRWYCSRIEPPQFCSFWGGGGEGPFEGPQIKWNKENVCVSVGCLSKQELGGVLCWPLRARTSQSPSAKQQQTRQLTVGHKRLLLALLRGLPWKLTDSPPPASLPLSPHVPSTGARLRSPGEAGKREEKQKRLSPCRYDLSGMWQRFTVCEQTRLWCQIQQRADGEGFLANSTFDHYLGTGLKLLTRWHIPLRDWYRACK